MSDPTSAKQTLRQEMRSLRRALPDQAERSARVWATVRPLPPVVAARTVMIFESVPGEPMTSGFVDWCHAAGKHVLFPEDDPPPDPASVDVVIVPGTAFTAMGDRLGQGGGWYDRFLPGVRDECITIGVGFAPQLVESLPTEPHDVRLDLVVTDAGVATPPDGEVADDTTGG